jgi:hypothetical protein
MNTPLPNGCQMARQIPSLCGYDFCLFLFITFISIWVCMEEANVEVHEEKAIMVSSYHLRFLTLMYY